MSVLKRAALALLFLISINANAWTRASDQRIAKKAAALAPPDLRVIIEKFNPEYQSGLSRTIATDVRTQIDAETKAAIHIVRANKPMSQLVEHLGVLAHLVAD